MIRNLKALGLVLAAVFAMTAVAASTASANYTITSDTATGITTLTGVQEGLHEFTTAGQTIKCTTATFKADTAGTEFEDATTFPTYAGCTYSAGAKEAHVTMNGCHYLITGATTSDGKHGVVHVKCPANAKIEVHLTNFNGTETCTLTVAEQTATEGYTLTDTGDHLVQHATARVKITPHGKGGCPLLVTGLYTGTTTIEGFEAKPHNATNKVALDIH